jgi:IS605 OrfB family transposase
VIVDVYDEGMKLTLQTQLLPERDHAARLKATVERFNEAADWAAGIAFEHRCSNKVVLQKIVYRELRDRFGLSAQMAVRCIAQVCEAYRRDKAIRPVFRPHAAMPFDQRIMSFKGVDRVSLLTLDGRILVPVIMGKYQAERYTNAKGQADLVLRRDGKWFLLVTVDVPDKTPIPATDFLGVDLGIVNLATDNEGEKFSGEKVERNRKRCATARKQHQRKGTKGAKKRLEKMSGRQRRFQTKTNHEISKKVVAKAKTLGVGIALEDLSGIRGRLEDTVNKRSRRRLGNWGFFQLRSFVEYKAKREGIPVVLVDARNTSRTCNVCGHCEKANRPNQETFRCKHCGHSEHADINAARNIRAWAVRNAARKLVDPRV